VDHLERLGFNCGHLLLFPHVSEAALFAQGLLLVPALRRFESQKVRVFLVHPFLSGLGLLLALRERHIRGVRVETLPFRRSYLLRPEVLIHILVRVHELHVLTHRRSVRVVQLLAFKSRHWAWILLLITIGIHL